MLLQVGGGATLRRGAWALATRLDVDWSPFGPGRVQPDPRVLALYPPGGIDLGRESVPATSVSFGIRRAL